MKLPKAIEILEDLATTSPQYPPEDRLEAVELAIVCLKTIHIITNETPK